MSSTHRISPAPPMPWNSWEALMALAIEEAEKAFSCNEVPVGAIVVDSKGTILGRGHNLVTTTNDPTAHAEVIALRQAAVFVGNCRLEGATLVSSLEPCLMCSGALIHARVSGLVYGAYDQKSGAIVSCTDALDMPFHNSCVWHMGGILNDECCDLLQRFFSTRR